MPVLMLDGLLLILVALLLLLLSGVWPPDSPWAPWWQMPRDVIEEMCKLAQISAKDTIYDLGCGTGWALITASMYGAKGVGIEIDPFRFLLATWNVWRKKAKKVTILKKNFFEVDLSPATVIFVYLIPRAIRDLTPKFLKELKPGTKLISYVYPLEMGLYKGKIQLVKEDKEKKIFVYKLLSV